MPSQSTQSSQSTKQQRNDSGLTVITPAAIASYAYVWKPRPSLKPGGEPQYSITLVFPKGTDLTPLRNAAKLAATRMFGATMPKNMKVPFRKGEEISDDAMFRGATVITARTNQKPGIVDRNTQPILDEMDFYSGCKCRASVYAFAYDQQGSKGVSFLLNNLQKLADGTRLSGRRPAEEEFAAVDGEQSDDEEDPFS